MMEDPDRIELVVNVLDQTDYFVVIEDAAGERSYIHKNHFEEEVEEGMQCVSLPRWVVVSKNLEI